MSSYRNAIQRATDLNKREAPGRGASLPDDGLPGKMHLKSVPNVPTERLHRAVEFYHAAVHTPEGLHDFDQPRRSLIETGVKLRSITHELGLRGVERGECRHCWGAPPTE